MRLLMFFILLFGCPQSNCFKIQSNEVSQIVQDSLIQYAKREFEIIEIKKRGDTLLIVSTNNVLFYPFGKYINFNEFKDGYLIKCDLKVKITSSFNIFKIFNIENETSSVKLMENTETKNLELLEADIRDNSFKLFYGIRIGMKKDEVFLIFFDKIPSGLNHIRIIKIASGLEGIWYYFKFSQMEQLECVIIESDYVVD